MPPRRARPRNVPSLDGKNIGWRFDLMDDERWPSPPLKTASILYS